MESAMTYFVYELRAPDTGKAFYVGYSKNLASTTSRHKNDPASVVYGRPFELVVLSRFDDKYEAMRDEGRRIAATPGLINRNRSLGISPVAG